MRNLSAQEILLCIVDRSQFRLSSTRRPRARRASACVGSACQVDRCCNISPPKLHLSVMRGGEGLIALQSFAEKVRSRLNNFFKNFANLLFPNFQTLS